jgi:hypothetical protein
VRLDDAGDRFVRPSHDLGEAPDRFLDDLGLGRVALDEFVGDREFRAPVQNQERSSGRRRPYALIKSVSQTAISDGKDS